jgi:cytoskeletal protein CcmA (bactofilin family)
LTGATRASYPAPGMSPTRKSDKDSAPVAGAPSVVSPGTTVDGEITGDGDLLIRGKVRGRVSLGGSLTVAPAGALEADVVAGGTVRLEASSRVEGDIRAPRVVIVDGASFRGSVDTSGAVPSAGPAAVPSPDAGT